MEKNEDSKSIKIGFLDLLEEYEAKTYIGAILITDKKGIPLEFRCTHPIKPSLINRQLYGEKLYSYIGQDICGIPLIKSLNQKPEIFITRNDNLIGLREKISLPVVFIRRAGKPIDVKNEDHKSTSLQEVRVEDKSLNYKPVIIDFHFDYLKDKEISTNIINQFISNFDPLEPFKRIEKAVQTILETDPRFK